MKIYISHPSVETLTLNKVFIDIQPVDSWDEWSYRIFMEDCMSPFFEAHSSQSGDCFYTYQSAFDDAIQWLKLNDYLTVVEKVF